MEQLSDAELIAASVDDGALFSVVYERWAEPLMSYFYRRTFDPEVSADLVAETFAVAYLKRGGFRPTRSPGGAWLYGIARRELSRYRRRRRVELRAVARLGVAVPHLDDESHERIEALVDLHSFRAEIVDAMGRLRDGERHAVVYRVLEERTYGDVAALLGCSEGAARVRVHRALAKLADWVEAPT